MKKCLSAYILLFFYLTQPSAQESGYKKGLHSISSDVIKTHLYYLASDEMKGRNTPSPELDTCAVFIAREYSKYGLKPVGDDESYFQYFNVLKTKLSEPNSFKVISDNGETEYKIKQDFVPVSLTANRGITAAVVFAGYGITAPEYKYDDYKNINVEGKIVVVFTHEPQEKDPSSVFEGIKMTDHGKILNKVINAREHGAVGMIVVTDPNHRFRRPPLSWPSLMRTPPKDGIPLTVEEKMENKIVVMRIGKNLAEILFEGTGKTMSAFQIRIDSTLTPQSIEISNLKVHMETNLRYDRTPTQNVVGLLEGSHPTLKNEVIVIGAHYDHVGARDDATIFNGADDNASGTVGIMTLAEAFSKSETIPKRSVLFCAWAGEEKGLFGSRYYVDSAPIFPLTTTIANINFDMIGRNHSGSVELVGISSSPVFQSILDFANEDLGFDYTERDDMINRSDYAPFYRKKIPVVGFLTGFHDDYHQITDTVEKCSPEGMAQICKLAFKFVWKMAENQNRPIFSSVN